MNIDNCIDATTNVSNQLTKVAFHGFSDKFKEANQTLCNKFRDWDDCGKIGLRPEPTVIMII